MTQTYFDIRYPNGAIRERVNVKEGEDAQTVFNSRVMPIITSEWTDGKWKVVKVLETVIVQGGDIEEHGECV